MHRTSIQAKLNKVETNQKKKFEHHTTDLSLSLSLSLTLLNALSTIECIQNDTIVNNDPKNEMGVVGSDDDVAVVEPFVWAPCWRCLLEM